MIRTAALICAALMLQGCLAAAIPVVAGSMMASRDVIKESSEDADGDQTGVVQVALAAPTTDPAPLTQSSEGGAEGVGEPMSEAQQTGASEPAKPTIMPAGPTSYAYANFAAYSLAQAVPGTGTLQSALLANPAALDGERLQCGEAPPAVLIDLDPVGGMFALEGSAIGDTALAAQLDMLRRQGVTVGWISQRLMIDAERVRATLVNSGLDPIGEDTLLLLQSFGQSKQQRRHAFGQDHCLVAIAGDTLSDFDELFDYLKDQNAAMRLHTLRDAGWFIAPPPLAPQAPETTE